MPSQGPKPNRPLGQPVVLRLRVPCTALLTNALGGNSRVSSHQKGFLSRMLLKNGFNQVKVPAPANKVIQQAAMKCPVPPRAPPEGPRQPALSAPSPWAEAGTNVLLQGSWAMLLRQPPHSPMQRLTAKLQQSSILIISAHTGTSYQRQHKPVKGIGRHVAGNATVPMGLPIRYVVPMLLLELKVQLLHTLRRPVSRRSQFRVTKLSKVQQGQVADMSAAYKLTLLRMCFLSLKAGATPAVLCLQAWCRMLCLCCQSHHLWLIVNQHHRHCQMTPSTRPPSKATGDRRKGGDTANLGPLHSPSYPMSALFSWSNQYRILRTAQLTPSMVRLFWHQTQLGRHLHRQTCWLMPCSSGCSCRSAGQRSPFGRGKRDPSRG